MGPRGGRWLLVLYPALYVVLGRWFAGERDFVGAHLLFVALWFYWTGLTRGARCGRSARACSSRSPRW